MIYNYAFEIETKDGGYFHGELELNYKIVNDYFDYEYGSICGTHHYDPEIEDLEWEIDSINDAGIVTLDDISELFEMLEKEVCEIDPGILISDALEI